MAALACPYVPLLNAPDALDIDDTLALLMETSRELSRVAGWDRPDAN